jgi:peptidoglycan/LPS O-acetylase OafA/YrhL
VLDFKEILSQPWRNMEASAVVAESPYLLKKSGLIPELDGVRGIAILLVLLFHFQGPKPASIPSIVLIPQGLGWSGVDLFFVLSGFLITGILVETRRSGNYFSSFYARRMLRIFPLYLVFIFACFEIALPLAHHFGYGEHSNNSLQMWYWLHLSNWRSAFGQDVGPLSHLWSLSIEEQFYLIWPMVVLLVRPSRLGYVCLALMVIPLSLRLAFVNSGFGWELLHRLTPFRIDSLAVGCLIALLVRNKLWLSIVRPRLRLITSFALALLLAVLVFAKTPSPGSPLMITWGYTTFALAYGCLVFSAYLYSGSSRWLASQLRSAPLRAFGRYSYAMYVIHWPIVGLLSKVLAPLAPKNGGIVLWILSPLLGILISFALSLVSWNLLEKHFLRLKGRFVARPSESSVGGRVPVRL